MKIKDVKKLTILDRFIYWITEREAIQQRRALNKNVLTDDEILSTYRFCNVVRVDDAVSMWLLTNWYYPYKDHDYMLPAVALARFFNLPTTLSVITEHVFDKYDGKKIKNAVRRLRDNGYNTFNSAYVVRGNDGEDKIECVVDYYVKPLIKQRHKLVDNTSMEETWNNLYQCFGFGSFMAGQVVADLRWAVSGSWKDKNTWAPIGPGSMRGLNRILYDWNRSKDKRWVQLSQEDFCKELMELAAKVDASGKVPPILLRTMEAHDWQNCLCEFDKYERTLWNEGKPKRLFERK